MKTAAETDLPTGIARISRDDLPLARPYAEPRTPTEQRLAAIWREALGLDRVGVDDDYHDLGGDSVCAAIIFSMLEEQTAVALPISTLVEASTIARLGVLIDRAAGREN